MKETHRHSRVAPPSEARLSRWLSLFGIVLALAASARADVVITVGRAFVAQIANRATITVAFDVDRAWRVHAPSEDADMHIAGRARDLQLPVVAEIMNARMAPDAVQLMRVQADRHGSVRMRAVWRLWCEHSGVEPQVQGVPVSPSTSTNPPHVFELHPVTMIDTVDLLPTLTPIPGYETKDAERAFRQYENARCHISADADTITLRTVAVGMNYVKFQMRLLTRAAPSPTGDGFIALAQISTLDGEVLVQRRRVIFIAGSSAAARAAHAPVGSCMRVLGMPRINLALVLWRIAHAAERPDVLDFTVPYEMVILADEGACSADD